jgi:4-aminobutyrate aminotransferase / (S)-3-amino-2-methylpropionate transaminase / 5-aminovalerate transaminase
MLRAHEGPLGDPSEPPIVWVEAVGATVTDADGRSYTDLSSGFGVAAVGHRNPRVAEAVRAQAGRLLHGLGDLHPTDVRARLAARLAGVAPSGLTRMLFALTGSGAVELALKTAHLATGRDAIVSFENGYHGTGLGALAACGWPEFREPFASWLPPARVVPWGAVPELGPDVACVVVEPMQGRGGVVPPPPGFLPGLRDACDTAGALLVVDEVFTGLGRTGDLWMSEAEGVRPDLLVCGKALGGGLPLAACLGAPELMDAAWAGRGEVAIDTHTHLGNPLSCAAALAVLDEIEQHELPRRGASLERVVREVLPSVRGRGLALGLPCDAVPVCARLLERGVIAVPAGRFADVLEISPPLTIAEDELRRALAVVAEVTP